MTMEDENAALRAKVGELEALITRMERDNRRACEQKYGELIQDVDRLTTERDRYAAGIRALIDACPACEGTSDECGACVQLRRLLNPTTTT